MSVATAHIPYYCPEGTSVVRVGNILFRLNLVDLILVSPVIEEAVGVGRTVLNARGKMLFTNARPLKLPSKLCPRDFERLLWVFYPLESTRAVTSFTPEDWHGLIRACACLKIPLL